MSDQSIESEIQAKGLTAPRVTFDDVKANIASEHYFTAEQGARHALLDAAVDECNPHRCLDPIDPALGLLTFCVLVLRNGFTVHGVSACASPENFNAELGRKIARENAVAQIWPLMGYKLKDDLAQQERLAAACRNSAGAVA